MVNRQNTKNTYENKHINNKKTQFYLNHKVKYNEKNNTPLLFSKKSKNIVIKPLISISSDTGKTRHFTPAAQEWFNSIYSYNNNYIKSLSIADKNLMYLLKSFFNSQIKDKLLKINTEPMVPRFRRLSGKRVFIGKGELKHTNSRVIITFYVYNTEGMFLSHKIRNLRYGLYFNQNKLKNKEIKDGEGKTTIVYNRLFTILEYLYLRQHFEEYLSYIISIVNKLTSQINAVNKYYNSLTNLVKKNILAKEEIFWIFNNKVKSIPIYNYPDFYFYLNIAKEEYKKNLYLNMILLKYNKAKFTRMFISKLVFLVQKIYNKKVQFNIVNLKKMHLNSDIYTQAVSLKLKNRDNTLYKVLKSSLRKIKLPIISKINEKKPKPSKDEFIVNKIRNNTINTMFITNKDNIYDSLENLLLKIFPSTDGIEINLIKRSSIKKRTISLKSYILKSLRHLNLRGIRVEAKGRLTRRFTASKSVFKMKWKGGLKNVDSSFRGLSTIMLRGIVKSNIQYSTIHNKNRIGAYGVKGWVSSK
jgi:hypothetical protein